VLVFVLVANIMKGVDIMKKILASVQVISAFIMSLSSAAIAAEDSDIMKADIT
jgi:hypothetical protein